MMTTNAMNVSGDRSGNSAGRASAAANVTTRRMPAHEAIVISRHPTGSAACRNRLRSRSSSVATVKIRRKRTTITTRLTSIAWPTPQASAADPETDPAPLLRHQPNPREQPGPLQPGNDASAAFPLPRDANRDAVQRRSHLPGRSPLPAHRSRRCGVLSGRSPNSSLEHSRDRRKARCGDGETGSRDAAPPPPTQQIEALNRAQPILPVGPGLPEKATHDYQRNGTTTLFAAFGGGHRHGHRPALSTSRRGRIPRLPQEGRPRLGFASSTWCATTTTPKSTLISRRAGEKRRIALHFTPAAGDPGSTWWKCSSASSPGGPSAAAPSTAQGTQRRPPDLHHRMKRRCHAFVSTETAEETLNSLPEYFSRISGAGHKSVLDARSDPKVPRFGHASPTT